MTQKRRTRDPEGTKKRILEAATRQFTTRGLAGARVDAIASAADTTERMLYYYFQSKEGLYIAVLEVMYADFVASESRLELEALKPSDAVRSLAHSIWNYFRENPQWLNLINNENLHRGEYLERSTKLEELLSPVLDIVRTTLARGAAAGEFRSDVDALDFYVTLMGMGCYTISNRFTLEILTGRKYGEPSVFETMAAMQVDILLAYLRAKPE